jgi:hypothetical protein
MARKQRISGKSLSGKIQRWIGLFLLVIGVFLLASLVTYDAGAYRKAVERGDVHFPFASDLSNIAVGTGSPRGLLAPLSANAGGGLGLWSAAILVLALGWVAVWVVPAVVLAWGWNHLAQKPSKPLLLKTLAALPLAATAAGMAAALFPDVWGGGLGEGIWSGVKGGIGAVGGALLLAMAAVGFFFLEAEAWDGRKGVWTRAVIRAASRGIWVALVFLARTLRIATVLLVRALRVAAVCLVRWTWKAIRGAWASLRWLAGRPWEHGASVEGPVVERGGVACTPPAKAASIDKVVWTPARIVDAGAEENVRETRPAVPAAPPSPRRESVPVVRLAEHTPGFRREEVAHQDLEAAVLEARRRAVAGRRAAVSRSAGRMVLPGVEILDDVPEAGSPVPERELQENSRLLTQTLAEFGVVGRVGEVHPGPVITRYEYIPGPGVRVAQILNRQDDLALKLRASRIRILAPIPGKAAVGIEVPNRTPQPIFLRRLLETRTFQEASGPLPLALGKDIGGGPVLTELSRMPHLLLAGTTGSGKSVCLNALLTSLLMKRTPAELRLLMIDPKMLELPMYNGIPHLLTDVVTDPKAAVRSFRWALLEMERRYRVLAARGCRNLASYNEKFEKDGPREEGEEKLPYIVVIIDELADLMITSGREVEEPIARLAQTARAVGIHLIVATQRPSVDVITGVIKANFPARIAFQVASRTDSRTILDQNGAESLLGKGDMLFLPPGQATPLRVHGAYVSEEETQRLAESWREQGKSEACAGLEEILAAEPEAAFGGLGDDPLFEDAARLVVTAGQASASLLQRRLKVGYARAARLVDMLEAAGVVSPQEGSKPREILVDEVRLEHVLAGELH